MKFKIGDRVSFLDDEGGGIVKKIINENIVNVAIEDGFEIPTAVSNLILTSPGNINLSAQDNDYPGYKDEGAYVADENISPLYTSPDSKDMPEEGIYFAIIPENQENPLAGDLSLNLLNYTHYQVLYSLYTNESGLFYGFDFGYLEPHSKVLFETIDRSKIEQWVNALAQIVFFKDGKAKILQPLSQLINFKPVKTYKEDAFKFENVLRSKALLIQLGTTKSQIVNPYQMKPVSNENQSLLKEKLSNERKQKTIKPKITSFLDKHKIDDKIAEVDLHINKLVDDFTNLDNNDLINMQIDYFQKCMQQAKIERISKIIFIHGVGDGVLKNEIIKHLKNTDGVQYYDASYNRYGMGATEVFFYRNE